MGVAREICVRVSCHVEWQKARAGTYVHVYYEFCRLHLVSSILYSSTSSKRLSKDTENLDLLRATMEFYTLKNQAMSVKLRQSQMSAEIIAKVFNVFPHSIVQSKTVVLQPQTMRATFALTR